MTSKSQSEHDGSAPDWSQRVINLELLLTHLERTLEELNSVILRHEARLDALDARLTRLDADVGGIRDTLTQPTKPEDEIPPHY